jgi:hypothetical protein
MRVETGVDLYIKFRLFLSDFIKILNTVRKAGFVKLS